MYFPGTSKLYMHITGVCPGVNIIQKRVKNLFSQLHFFISLQVGTGLTQPAPANSPRFERKQG